jgi:hypothetical protein
LTRLSDLAERFVRRLTRYQSCCVRIEEQFELKRLKITDVELLYTSSFLSVCCLWESFLEATLYESVCGEESKKRGNQRRASFRKPTYLEEVLLFPNKDYLSIPTLKHAEAMNALFVKDGRPISAVSERNRTLLHQAVRIRNAIAHQTSFALGKFQESVPGVSALPRSKRTPGAFLRHEFRIAPSQRRYELYLAAYQSAAGEICSAW